MTKEKPRAGLNPGGSGSGKKVDAADAAGRASPKPVESRRSGRPPSVAFAGNLFLHAAADHASLHEIAAAGVASGDRAEETKKRQPERLPFHIL